MVLGEIMNYKRIILPIFILFGGTSLSLAMRSLDNNQAQLNQNNKQSNSTQKNTQQRNNTNYYQQGMQETKQKIKQVSQVSGKQHSNTQQKKFDQKVHNNSHNNTRNNSHNNSYISHNKIEEKIQEKIKEKPIYTTYGLRVCARLKKDLDEGGEISLADQEDVNKTDDNYSNQTVLHVAVSNGLINMVKALVKAGADVHAKDKLGNTVLRYAALCSDSKILKFLLETTDIKNDINVKDGIQGTPLFDTCEKGNIENAKILIQYGADINAQGERNYHPSKEVLNAALEAEFSYARGVKKPAIDGFDVDCWSSGRACDGSSSLHVASLKGHLDIVNLLIKNNADVNIRDENHITPLHVAAQQGHVFIIETLLKAGADPKAETIETDLTVSVPEVAWKNYMFGKNRYTSKNITPLFVAILSGKTDAAEKLIPYSNINNAVGSFEATPLHCASLLGRCEIVTILIENNANFLSLLRGKHRADEIAEAYGKKDIVVLLGNRLKEYRYSLERRSLEEKVLLGNKGEIVPGLYYQTKDGRIKLANVMNLKKPMINNHLLNLDYSKCLKKNNTNDEFHNFSEDVEKLLGDQACVVVNTKSSKKLFDIKRKFNLCVTIPGAIHKKSGVFEFAINKNLYKEKGECCHRFFNPKGTVGASEFGAKYRAKEQNKEQKKLTYS
jgi:ankyrin repeat protein